MPIDASQIAGQLGKGAPLQTLYVIAGDEPLQAQEAADALRAAARAAGYSERQVFVQSGAHADWSSVLGALASRGLFDDQRLIEIRIPTGKPGKEGGAALLRYAELTRDADGVLSLIHLPRPDGAMRKAEWFKALTNHGTLITADPIARERLAPWLAARLAQQGQRVPAGDAGAQALALLAERVEGNLLAAHQELQKLALIYPPGELSLAQIDDAVGDVARLTTAQLCAAALSGRPERVLRVLGNLMAAGENPVQAHYPLADELRGIARMQRALAAGEPPPMATRSAGLWGEQGARIERLAPRLAHDVVARLLMAAQQSDGVLKGLKRPDWPGEPWDALRQFALQVAQAVHASPPPRARMGG